MSNPIDAFEDKYIKNILDFGSVDTGLIYFSRPYDFSLSGASFDLTGVKNVFVHTFDQSIYPSSLSTATGWAVYASKDNSASGYYYTSLMQLFNFRVLANHDGLYSTTSVTSSVSAVNFINEGKFNMDLFQGDPTIWQTVSANLTGVYVYNFDREVYGDRIYDGSLSMYANNALVAFDANGVVNRNAVVSLSSSIYGDSATSVTRFWAMPDIGKIIVWSNDLGTMNGLSSVTEIKFRNSIAVSNTTVNLRIEPNEYNLSDNFSFYLRDYSGGELPDTWITSIQLYNPWNDLIAVCKLQKPIRKTPNVHLTFKIVIDHL